MIETREQIERDLGIRLASGLQARYFQGAGKYWVDRILALPRTECDLPNWMPGVVAYLINAEGDIVNGAWDSETVQKWREFQRDIPSWASCRIVSPEVAADLLRAKLKGAADACLGQDQRAVSHLAIILSLFDDAGMFTATLDQQIVAVKAAKRAIAS